MKGKKILQNFAAFPGSTDGAQGPRGALFLWDLVAAAPEYFDLNGLVNAPPGVVLTSGNGIASRSGTTRILLVAEAMASPTRAVLLVEEQSVPALPGTLPAWLGAALVVAFATTALLRRPAARGVSGRVRRG
jgi:hypothetical protein